MKLGFLYGGKRKSDMFPPIHGSCRSQGGRNTCKWKYAQVRSFKTEQNHWCQRTTSEGLCGLGVGSGRVRETVVPGVWRMEAPWQSCSGQIFPAEHTWRKKCKRIILEQSAAVCAIYTFNWFRLIKRAAGHFVAITCWRLKKVKCDCGPLCVTSVCYTMWERRYAALYMCSNAPVQI